MKVLVVDDDRTSLEMMGSILRDAGFEPVLLSSPIGATQTIQQEKIGAVVLDVNMPSIPGDRLARLIRGNSRWRELPVILVSGALDLARIAEGLEGVTYLEKERIGDELALHVAGRVGSRRAAERASYPPSPGRRLLRRQLVEGFLRTTPGMSDMLRRILARAAQEVHSASTYLEAKAVLHQLKGEAQVLGLAGIARLLLALEEGVTYLSRGFPLRPPLGTALARGLDQLHHVPSDANDAMAFDPSDEILAIERAMEDVVAWRGLSARARGGRARRSARAGGSRSRWSS